MKADITHSTTEAMLQTSKHSAFMSESAKYIYSVPHTRFEFLAAMNTEIEVFWNVAPFSFVEAYELPSS